MYTDQDSLLSAYLDGQVDPDQRRRAEAAVASDPAAAEALRSLSGVRDLVAGLSRPRARDVSVDVLNRIAVDAARPRRWKTWGPYVGRGLGASAVAASLGLVVLVGVDSRLRGPSDPPRLRGSGTPETLAAHAPAAEPPVPTAVSTPAVPTKVVDSASPPPPAPSPVAEVAEAPTPPRDQPAGFRELWETVGARRDFVVSADPAEATTETVATLLGQSSHRDFYKIVVPSETGPAAGDDVTVAFAATLDPQEFATLRGRLESEFRSGLVVRESDPEVTALLADVGHVTASSASPAADVAFPRTEQAIRFLTAASSSPRPEPIDPDSSRPDDATPPLTTADPTGPSVVLIWIVDPSAKGR